MSKLPNVAIAGATGAVGIEMIRTLEKRNFPLNSLRLLASKRSAGKELEFRGKKIVIEEMTEDSFEGVDIALFSAGGSQSKTYGPAAVKAGAIVVDNSSAFRMDPDVPLVVPEVNPEAVKDHKGIIANPNCTTIIMLVALNPLHKISPIKRIVVSTYQSASGAGAAAMQELEDQNKAIARGEEPQAEIFPYLIANNLFAHNSPIDDNGYCEEEMKMVNETRKIMNDDRILVSPTCIRVGIPRAHSEAITVEFENEVTVEQARAAIESAPGAVLIDDRIKNYYPMPIEFSGQDDVGVGRFRKDLGFNNALSLFCCGDQLLKGAALNAVQIAELL
ncbi:MAG: aspartate-semialdehyde dehydrogenase [Lentisphaeria bacterium]|nr:aspartate-semialdehyde dehydrogenase [Lentisphaeria bacterium]